MISNVALFYINPLRKPFKDFFLGHWLWVKSESYIINKIYLHMKWLEHISQSCLFTLKVNTSPRIRIESISILLNTCIQYYLLNSEKLMAIFLFVSNLKIEDIYNLPTRIADQDNHMKKNKSLTLADTLQIGLSMNRETSDISFKTFFLILKPYTYTATKIFK